MERDRAGHEELARVLEEAARSAGIEIRTVASPGSVLAVPPDSTPLLRARAALEELDALALDTAEHHPYWEHLSLCCQIARAVLDGWEGSVAPQEAEHARRSAERLAESCSRL